ncbi:hypothetical protein ACFY0A_26205 [Streptomyces sp. NPDC001698]|uniref:hypothetical protein n=1 Tax=Streptomyces sp. NPDC001698 TaxID=3364601 RepID=UPI0036B7AA85
MTAADHRAAVVRNAHGPQPGRVTEAPWDPGLAEAMAEHGVPSWVGTWTSRPWNQPDVGWSGHASTCGASTPCGILGACRLRVIRRRMNSGRI